VSHDDNLRRLNGKFAVAHRYANFGPLLQSLEIRGFRGINDLTLTVQSPITALSGLNGTGKSTIAQLASCGYRKASTATLPRYYVKDFFPVSAADPEPFSPQGQVVYSYCVQRGADPQQVTVSRKAREWSGYKRQSERACYHIGFTQFLPKVERRDFSIYGGHVLRLGESRALSEEAAANVSKILALPYEQLDFTEVSHYARTAELAMATRNGQRYSENHMGFGEGRVVYVVNTMEAAPAQSLFVLEEPETSLHGDAQCRLARYLVEVAGRRGHQIILTTHGAEMLRQLSRESVVYLRRHPDGTLSATTGLSTYQVDSYLLSEGRPIGGTTICVEDSFARYLTIEILRQCDPDLLAGCSIITIGGGREIPAAVKLLRGAGLRTVGLSDGDMNDHGEGAVMSLPGSRAPEIEVFTDPAVAEHFANSPYKIALDEILAPVSDHHDYVAVIARKLMLEESYVATDACRAYASTRDSQEFTDVLAFLRGEFGDRR
jgi:predicted ATPase